MSQEQTVLALRNLLVRLDAVGWDLIRLQDAIDQLRLALGDPEAGHAVDVGEDPWTTPTH